MTAEHLAARLSAAVEIAKEAGAIARRYFRKSYMLDIREKTPGELLTAADLAVDQFINGRISNLFPDDRILSEESAGGGGGGDLWVIDPIDGTANFARGIGHFAISIAFLSGGIVELGVVYNVMAGEMFAARHGHGASCNGAAIHIRRNRDVGAVLIECGYSTRHPIDTYLDCVRTICARGYGFCQNGSAALGLAHVACGRIDGYWEPHLFGWDVLAGLLLVREAGGWTSRFESSGDILGGRAVLACAAAIAPDLRMITGIGGEGGGELADGG